MQNILIEKPYRFIPPHRGTGWSRLIRRFNLHAQYLRRYGIVDYECRGAERLRRSLEQGHGILLTPNHCRMADPVVLGWLAREAGCFLYAMASWHLFHQDRFTAWAIHKMGAFSVYREGVDRQAINTAIEVLQHAERPLIIFPEGAVTRTNDRLHALLDGVAFIARTAAKRRAREVSGGKVVVHPVALKYLFQGDFPAAVDPVLTEIETRFSWQPQTHLPAVDRIAKLGRALLCLKELEYFGQPQPGTLHERLQGLIDRLLCPLEEEWFGKTQAGPVIPRVKTLRMKILPEMVRNQLSKHEREHRWRQLADLYLAQQISCYLPDYIPSYPSVDRLLETVERFEEDLTDSVRVLGALKVIIEVGEPIEVSPQREKGVPTDPLMTRLEQELQRMLDQLARESPLYSDLYGGEPPPSELRSVGSRSPALRQTHPG